MTLEMWRWAGAGLLAGLVVLLVISQPIAAMRLHKASPERSRSLIPFTRGLIGVGAVSLAPVDTLFQRLTWAWIPLLMDITRIGFGWLFVCTTLGKDPSDFSWRDRRE